MKWVVALVLLIGAVAHADEPTPIKLRAWGVPNGFYIGPVAEADRQVIDAFRKAYPHVDPVATTGLTLPGSKSMDMVPFMQIAGDMAPDVMFVNFRQSQTYIDMKLLYPLDRYVERMAGVTLGDSSAMRNEAYVAALKQGPGWKTMPGRELEPCWPVIRRHCPYGEKCPHREESALQPLADHYHIWAWPVGPLATAMQYDRTLLAEHADKGIEMRTPRDWEELLAWGKLLTNPAENTYGLEVSTAVPGWSYANFLYSAGGRVVEQDAQGRWQCTLDSEAAAEAAYYWARLRMEKVVRDGKFITRGVIKASESQGSGPTRFGFKLTYVDDQFFSAATDQTKGLGPMPAGPTGLRRGELNFSMLGIFSGLAKNEARRHAAWAYMTFYDGETARRIRTETMVEAGLGPFVRRELLEKFNTGGRYDSIIRRIPPGLEETYRVAFAGGEPEPYGKNCQYVYDELTKPLGAIWSSKTIEAAIDAGDAEAAKVEIRQILKRANERINQKMLGNLPPEDAARRNRVAWAVIVIVMGAFAVVMLMVFRAFTPPELRRPLRLTWLGNLLAPLAMSRFVGTTPLEPMARSPAVVVPTPKVSGWRKKRYLRAWVLLTPALLLIGIWMYWPMLQGTAIAFQDYSVLGDSQYVGARNFASVLYSGEFWYSLRLSLTYAVLFFVFGFWAPIGLALLLSEVPRGGIFFRTIYYLPAVLSGVVVIFLWKSFYGPSGMVNQVLNGLAWLLNFVPGVSIGTFNGDWLQDPTFAMFFCLLPTVWAGMGPGCLIYLAALKTIPDELYEAADIDGAGMRQKLFAVALPTIKTLVTINFIGAMIGAIRGAGGFMLAMTGGGPYGEQGGATEVIGLKIFYTTFGYLQFGMGAAMAWILGAMLIGFTVFQLKRMSNLEFRTAKV
jgi:ABC-type sugar transport system permease subunit